MPVSSLNRTRRRERIPLINCVGSYRRLGLAELRHHHGDSRQGTRDKFHVLKPVSDAVDIVRKAESRSLASEGINTLKGTNYT